MKKTNKMRNRMMCLLAVFVASSASAQQRQPEQVPKKISAVLGINMDELNQRILEIVGAKTQGSLSVRSYHRTSERYSQTLNASFVRFLAELEPWNRQVSQFVQELNAVKSAGLTLEQKVMAYKQLQLKKNRLQTTWTPFYAAKLKALFEAALDGYPFDFAYRKLKSPLSYFSYYPLVFNPMSLFSSHNVVLQNAAGKSIAAFKFDSVHKSTLQGGLKYFQSPSGLAGDYDFRSSWDDGYDEKCSQVDHRQLVCRLGGWTYTFDDPGLVSRMEGISPSDPLVMLLFIFDATQNAGSDRLSLNQVFDRAYRPIMMKGCASELCVQFHGLDVRSVYDQLFERLAKLTVPLDVPEELKSILSPTIVLDASRTLPLPVSMEIMQVFERDHPIFGNLQD